MARPDVNNLGKKYTDQLGLGANFFHNLKRTNMECFKHINDKAPGDIVKAYRLYMEEKRVVSEEACRIYVELEDNYMIQKFGGFLVFNGIYSASSTYFYTHRVIFKIDGIKSHKSFMLIKQSNDLYQEFQALLKKSA